MGLAGEQGEYRAEARVDIDAKGKKRGREELETDQRHAFEIWKVLETNKNFHEISERVALWLTGLICALRTAWMRRRTADEKA